MNTGKTRFKKGKSGNPNGRPKKGQEQLNLEKLCREKTPEALGTILSIMQDGENERNKLSAAQYIIDRGWGKAKETVSLTDPDGGAAKIIHEIILRPL